MNTNMNKVGLVFGAFFAGVHLMWSLLVFLGWGQSFIDFILWAHMVHVPYTVGPFDVTAFGTLIVVTAVIGYAMGCFASMVWNKVHG